ncbi:MAG: hypothetical protein B6D63_06590 [Candidatus Latescibacteria bacterium 4484_7]|nr:MAG: hypothetical protein B6D63_06590 [Candidatus Latescibacteria bacterium 4484_7]
MKIAVISDTHDHLDNLAKAIDEINGLDTEILLHCGDLCSPFVIDRLAKFKGEVHVVFGNNDGDRFRISKVAERFENITIHGEIGIVETPVGELAFAHKPETAIGFTHTGRYKAVFYGHTHRRRTEMADGTPFINPGELMGLIEEPGYILFDMDDGSVEHFAVK